MDNNTVALAAIALAGTICTGFFAMINKLNKSIDKMSDSNSKAAEAGQEVAKWTKTAAKEAKQRNGHLAELVIKTADGVKDAIGKPVNIQTVETQVIKEQK